MRLADIANEMKNLQSINEDGKEFKKRPGLKFCCAQQPLLPMIEIKNIVPPLFANMQSVSELIDS